MCSDTALDALYASALDLLRALIAAPSFSGDEAMTASIIEQFLRDAGAEPRRAGNNVWALCPDFDPAKPTLLLNGHHDTVRPNSAYTRDPFVPDLADDRLYGLGSNDAGGALAALAVAFLACAPDCGAWNLIFSATGEEENSGPGGVESLLPLLPRADAALVGEPTGMHMATAERGLLVLDGTAYGRAGHAARNEGLNALYLALDDIARLRAFRFERESPLLGPVSMNVTVIRAGTLHNMVPERCEFTVDVRTTDAYTHEEIVTALRAALSSELSPRSMRLRASAIADTHPLVRAGRGIGLEAYGSPTTSNKALLPIPALKLGPGESARSHTADEFIMLDELRQGIRIYIDLLRKLRQSTP